MVCWVSALQRDPMTSRTDSLADGPNSLTYWQSDWLIDWLTDCLKWLTHWLTDWRTCWLIDWQTGWLPDWPPPWVSWLIDWLGGSLANYFTTITVVRIYYLYTYVSAHLFYSLANWPIVPHICGVLVFRSGSTAPPSLRSPNLPALIARLPSISRHFSHATHQTPLISHQSRQKTAWTAPSYSHRTELFKYHSFHTQGLWRNCWAGGRRFSLLALVRHAIFGSVLLNVVRGSHDTNICVSCLGSVVRFFWFEFPAAPAHHIVSHHANMTRTHAHTRPTNTSHMHPHFAQLGSSLSFFLGVTGSSLAWRNLQSQWQKSEVYKVNLPKQSPPFRSKYFPIRRRPMDSETWRVWVPSAQRPQKAQFKW